MKFGGIVSRFAATAATATAAVAAAPETSPATAKAKVRGGFPEAAVQSVADLWRQVSSIPVIKRATLHSEALATLQLEWSDPDSGKRPIVERTLLLDNRRTAQLLPQLPTAVADLGVGPVFASPSRRRCLRFSQSGDEWFAQVWDAHGHLEAKVSTKAIHAAPLLDVSLQSVSWSDDETQVIYVADRLRAKQPMAWAPAGEGACEKRAAFEALESWGEQYPDVTNTTLILLTIPQAKLVDVLPKSFTDVCSAACPVLAKDGRFVTFVSYAHTPRRMGIAFCTSRDSKLFTCTIGGGASSSAVPSTLEPPVEHTFTRSLKCLSRRPGSDRIACLAAAPSSKAHMTCSSVVVLEPTLDDATRTVTVRHAEIVPLVEAPAGPNEFPGIYASTGNGDVQWLDENSILVSSGRYSNAVVYRIAIGSSSATPHLITPVDTKPGNWAILDVHRGLVLLSHSNTAAPPSLYLWDGTATAPPTLLLEGLSFAPASIRGDLAALAAPTLHRIDGTHGFIESWLSHGAKSNDDHGAQKQNPAMLFVHGGPHSCDTSTFSRLLTMHLLAGFDILSVNYGGSTGFGQGRIDVLAGQVGTADVKDSMLALRDAISKGLITADPKKLVVSGGSHGGFLTSHLIGQFPDAFAAATMRNPVTNIASMAYETDIPDWCAFEAQTALDDAAKLFAISPMAHVHKVKTPTMVGIGQGDLRVPPSQGRGWCHAVRGNGLGAVVRLMEYPNVGHGLDTVPAEADFAIMSILFLTSNIENTTEAAV